MEESFPHMEYVDSNGKEISIRKTCGKFVKLKKLAKFFTQKWIFVDSPICFDSELACGALIIQNKLNSPLPDIRSCQLG